MKRFHLFCLAAVLLSIAPVKADLYVHEYVSGQKVTLDTATGYYWYWNLPDFNYKTYDEQITDIASLGMYGNIAGGWHMASRSEMDTLWANSAESVTDSFAMTYDNPDPSKYDLWMDRYDDQYSPTEHFVGGARRKPGITELITLGTMVMSDDDSAQPHAAWIVTNQTVIPSPGAFILAATGLFSSSLGLKRLRR